jgi:hypothetical protein
MLIMEGMKKESGCQANNFNKLVYFRHVFALFGTRIHNPALRYEGVYETNLV